MDLVFAEEFGVELDVPGLVHAMHVSKGRGNCKEVRDLGELAVNVPNVFGLGVEGGIVDMLVVDAVLFASGDANLHFEEASHGGHAGQVLFADLNVFLFGLFGEIEHVGGEEGLSVGLEVLFVGFEHAVEPRQQVFGTVIRVNCFPLSSDRSESFFFFFHKKK